jgi:hypothetical protein
MLRAAQRQIADRKADRRDHQHGESRYAEIITDGATDHQQAERRDGNANGLHARRQLLEQQRGKGDGEQRLALHDHAGQTDRHALRDGKGLRQELP